MKKIKSTIDNLFNKKNRKNNSGRYKTYNVSTLDDLVDELDNPAKQERVLANQVKKKKYEKWCLTFGYDIQHQICIPEGMFKMLWLVMVILLIIFYLAVVPLRMAFSYTSDHPFINGDKEWYGLDIFADVVFILDIIFNFFTPYRTSDGEIESDHKKIARAYCQQWFWLDAIASFPSSAFGPGGSGINKLLRTLRIFKLLRVFRLTRTLRSLNLDFLLLIDQTFVRVTRLVLALVVLLHFMACAYWGVATNETFCDWSGYYAEEQNLKASRNLTSSIYEKINSFKSSGFTDNGVNEQPFGYHQCQKDWVPWRGLMTEDWVTQYLQSLFWAVTATTGKGKPIYPRTNLQTAFTAGSVIVGVLLYAVIIGSLSSALHSQDAAGAIRRRKMDAVNEYLIRHRVPKSLTRRIRDYYDYMFAARHAFGEQNLLNDLPRSLQIRLNVSMNHRRIRKIPIFDSVPDECVLAIIEKLKSVVTIPGEYIVNSGEWGTKLYIIENGRVVLTIPKSGRRFSFTGMQVDLQQQARKTKTSLKNKEKKHLEYLGWRAELIRMKHRKRGEVVVKDLVAGDFFGEEALFHEVESLSARSITYCDLLYLATSDMESVATEFPVLAKSLEQEMANREQERAMVDKHERQRLQKRRSSGSNGKRSIGGRNAINNNADGKNNGLDKNNNMSKYQVLPSPPSSNSNSDIIEDKNDDGNDFGVVDHEDNVNVNNNKSVNSNINSNYSTNEDIILLNKRIDDINNKMNKILELLKNNMGENNYGNEEEDVN